MLDEATASGTALEDDRSAALVASLAQHARCAVGGHGRATSWASTAQALRRDRSRRRARAVLEAAYKTNQPRRVGALLYGE